MSIGIAHSSNNFRQTWGKIIVSTGTTYSDLPHGDIVEILSRFHSFEPGARENALAALKRLDLQYVMSVLGELVRNPDPDLRCDAAEALLRIDSAKALDLVIPLLTDSIESVRWNVCGLLHDFANWQAVPPLVRVLLHDPAGCVRMMAAWALGGIGDTLAIPALQEAVDSDPGTDHEGRSVRDTAMQAIQDIEGRV